VWSSGLTGLTFLDRRFRWCLAGVSFLAPEEAALEAMLAGWVAQQRSRLLVASTVEQRVLVVRRFVAFSSDYPWQWSPGDVEEWTTSLVSQGLAHSTIRNYVAIATLPCDVEPPGMAVAARSGPR